MANGRFQKIWIYLKIGHDLGGYNTEGQATYVLKNSFCKNSDYPTSIECSLGSWFYYNGSAWEMDPYLRIDCNGNVYKILSIKNVKPSNKDEKMNS